MIGFAPATLIDARLERASGGRLRLAEAQGSLPAAALGLGIPRLAPLRLSGDVRVKISHLSLEHGRMHGDATLQWRGAGSALTPVSPLGEYEVRFKAAGPAVHAALSTLQGPLELDGKRTWSNGGPPSFLATARVPALHREQLSRLLLLIAVERGAGLFELQLEQDGFR